MPPLRSARYTLRVRRFLRLASAIVVALVVGAAISDAAELIVIVRHAEREAGQGDDGLSAAGKARAEKLVFVLQDVGITHVLTSDRRRTIETAGPLMKARGLKPEIIPIEEPMAGGDPAERQVRLTAEAIQKLPENARVLVAGHSNTVPLLLKALGVAATVTIPETEFDNLFIVAPRPSGPPVLTRLRY